jgi:hypothetical protein
MKKQVKRTILLLLVAVILFAASMAIPIIYNSKLRDIFQGAALGFMVAGIISIVLLLLGMIKKNKA